MHSKMPRFQNFFLEPLVTHSFSAPKLCLWCNFFPYLPTPKLLPPSKTSLKTLERVNIDVSGYEQALCTPQSLQSPYLWAGVCGWNLAMWPYYNSNETSKWSTPLAKLFSNLRHNFQISPLVKFNLFLFIVSSVLTGYFAVAVINFVTKDDEDLATALQACEDSSTGRRYESHFSRQRQFRRRLKKKLQGQLKREAKDVCELY